MLVASEKDAGFAFTFTACQVVPWSKDRCRPPVELMVQRAAGASKVSAEPPDVSEGVEAAMVDAGAELPAVCAAYDATIHLASIRGLRALPFREFNIGFMATALEADGMVAAIDLPVWRQGHGYGFQEFARRHGDFALAGAAALLDVGANNIVRQAALALCGVAVSPLRVEAAEARLIGQPLDAALIQSAAAAAWLVEPISDIHASGDYRRHLAQVLSTRALVDAARRAGVDMPNVV